MLPINPMLLLRAGAALAVLVAAWWALDTYGDGREADGRAAVQAKWDNAVAKQAKADLQAEKGARATEAAGQTIIQKEVRDARANDPVAARAAADLRDARQRVQHLADLFAAATLEAGATAGPAIGGEAAAGPGLVLADLYRGADAEAAELAEAFDQARARGLRCERISDEVRAIFNTDDGGPAGATTPQEGAPDGDN